MSDTKHSYKSFKQFRLWILILLLLGFIIFVTNSTYAQEGDEPWAVPVNLSLSGGATDPRIVVDSTGGLHVLWREDAANSFYYTHVVNGEWANAIPLEAPFGTIRYLREELGDRFNVGTLTPLYNPELVATQDGRIHAFWLDDLNNLFHSSVSTNDFTNYDSWTYRELISASVSDSSYAVDNEGSIHLIYVNKSDLEGSPAGIYYRRWNVADQTWSEPIAVFESAYFRGALKENLNLQITVGESPGQGSEIYVVLDNRPLEEVVLIRSEDRAATWEEPIIVDRRELEDTTSSVGPSNIQVITTGDQLHMIWTAGHTSQCQLYHQWSEDGGRTWQQASTLETDFDGCPTNYWLLNGANDLFYLLAATTEGEYYLQAWNGERWSQGEYESLLADFEDPLTRRNVLLGCQQFVVDQENNLVSVGCGSSTDKNDIWLIERPLGQEEDWFPTTLKTWSDPISFAASENALLDPLIFSDDGNLLHIFWIASGDEASTGSNADIYYTSWNGEDWSRQVPLIHLNSNQADELTGLYNSDIGLFLLWRDAKTNAYYYSSVLGKDILLPAEWSSPTVFPKINSEALFSAPVPFLDDEEVLNIAYAVPLNENRGIYLIQAGEDHQTWSEPITIVDAVNENWAMVDRPSVTQTENGDIHLIFTTYSLLPEPVAQALYYTRSEDGGMTWSEAQLIREGNIGWNKIVGIDSQKLVITWQENDDNQFMLMSQQSIDNGLAWDRPVILFESSAPFDSFDLLTELPDNPYLVQVQKDQTGNLMLQERIWDINGWQPVESYDLATRLENESLINLSSTITPDGQLIAIFNTEDSTLTGSNDPNSNQSASQGVEITPSISDVLKNNLFFTQRSIDLSMLGQSGSQGMEEAATPVPTLEAISGTDSNSDNAQPEAIDDGDQTNIDTEGIAVASEQSTSDVVRILIGLAPAVLIVLLVFAFGLRKALPKG